MRRKQVYSFDDLAQYCKANNITHFSAKEIGHPLVISTYGEVEYSASNDPSLMEVVLKACHCGLNRNNSTISEDVMTSALPSFANKPILAEIIDTDDGKDFGSHAMEYDTDADGNEVVYYIERPVGIVPESNNAHLEYDEEMDKKYVVVKGYIFNYYGNETSDILKKKNGTKVSVELSIDDFAWSSTENALQINKFSFDGVTLLGESVGEGMLGSRLDIANFSEEKMDYSAEIKSMQERLDKLISCLSIDENHGKEEKPLMENEEIQVENEVTEVAEVAEEVTEETTEEEVTETVTENESEQVNEETPEVVETESVEETHEEEVTEEPHEEETTEFEVNTTKKYSIEVGGEVKTFEISLDEKIYALENLVNVAYSDSDNDYYYAKAYDTYVVMIGYWSGRAYRQSYTQEDGTFTLTGDRVEVFAQYLTQEEIDSLESMKSSYSEIKSELDKYHYDEQFADKMTIFEDEAYSDYLDTDEFKALMSKDSVDKFSKDELQEKADATLGKIVKMNKTFSYSEKRNVNKVSVPLNVVAKEDKPYGNLFD